MCASYLFLNKMFSSSVIRLIVNGWVLIIFGGSTTNTNPGTGEWSHTLRPMLLTVTRSEEHVAFEATFDECKKAAREYAGCIAQIDGCTMDRSDATALGLENSLGHREATIGCFTHVDRNFVLQLTANGITHECKGSWINRLELLRRAPSVPSFTFASLMLLDELARKGMSDVADWFKKTYLNTTHGKFAYCHTKPGVQPMNQLLESVNAAIKDLIELYLNMGEFCEKGLPAILRYSN